MHTICLQEEKMSKLLDAIIDLNIPKYSGENKNLFIDRDEALQLLRCSTGTLQKFRDEQLIDYYQITPKLIIYSRDSIMKFINSKKNTI